MDKTLRLRPSVNWILWAGLFLVLLIVLVAIIGPSIAPADPLQESYIAKLGERFIKPPFPPNAIEGYPLGSDEFGRDLLSRLLWAIRPTMTLVLVVAAVRLVVGIAAGLITGWSNTPLSKFLDLLISAFLTAPVFFVALCVIALTGSKWGVWAFILGLSITGWAEAARIVREQTRAIKSQTFVEASRAMGAAPEQLILSHILPHVLPMMWIQLAFEIAGTLLGSAALGFLGYYMNGIWIAVGDWVGQRTTGYPELAEMLGAATTLHVPWSALFAGSVVVFIVLSFNILGEGLRQQLNPDRQRKRADMNRGSVRVAAWMEEKVYVGVQGAVRLASANGVVLLLGVLLVGGMWLIWSSQTSAEAKTVVSVPGGHLWATSRHDSQGTFWTDAVGPAQAGEAWTFEADDYFTGGPVVNAAGQIFMTNNDGYVYALNSSGQLIWKAKLPVQTTDPSMVNTTGVTMLNTGPLAIAPNGNIMVVTADASLTAFSPGGEVLWTKKYVEDERPLSGPVVAQDGTSYYPTNAHIIAVYPSGNLRFLVNLPTFSIVDPLPRLSLDDHYLFFEDTVVDAASGSLLFDQTGPPMDAYVVGADGRNYVRAQEGMNEWQPTEKGYVLIKKSTFNSRALSLDFRRPEEAGISPGGNEWVVFASGFDVPAFVWIDVRRDATAVFNFPTPGSRLIGIDQAGRMYMCSEPIQSSSFCRAYNVSNGNLEWEYELPLSAGLMGGAIVPGKLYVVMSKYVFAIGVQPGEVAAVSPTPAATESASGEVSQTTPAAESDCSRPACRAPTYNTPGAAIFLPLVANTDATPPAPDAAAEPTSLPTDAGAYPSP